MTPAKTLAMMAVDLLSNDAATARKILSQHQAAMTKELYLERQTSVFQREVFDGTK